MTKTNNKGQTMKIIAGLALTAGTLGLAACGGEAPAPVEEASNAVPGVTIENARMVLNAVDGNPAAVYFDFKYDSDRSLSITRASVAQAGSAMLHDYGEYDFKVQMMEALPIPVSQGSEIEFKPGGLHVMAFDVSPDLRPGDTAEVSLVFTGGDAHAFDAEVLAAGDERVGGDGDDS